MKPLLLGLLCAALLGAGCGGDDETVTTSTIGVSGPSGPSGASGASGASGEDGEEQGPPIELEAARTNLEQAGFTVEDQAGDDLVQETADGTVDAEAGLRVFEPGDPADAVIQQFASSANAEDVAESLEVGFFAVEIRDNVVLFAVKDQQALLDEIVTAAEG
ncbi:MAG: hypothetical protein ACR2OC_12050 [Solirubrobacterales bacterium]